MSFYRSRTVPTRRLLSPSVWQQMNFATCVAALLFMARLAEGGQNPGPLTNITSFATPLLLEDVAPPLLSAPPDPSGLSLFVQDRMALLQMGKALFWDMQVGSDGIQACASCHFHAGADNRIKNQISPGINV